jgi:methyltransferase
VIYYPIFLILNAIEMIWEARISARNSAALIKKGAIEIEPRLLPIMVGLYVLLFAGSYLEYLLIPKNISLWWFGTFVLVYFIAKALKYWAVSSLGDFWTMKVLIVPGSTVVTSGPYRYIRHPNYIAVLLEITATALAGKSYITFMIVFGLFLVVLYYRIRCEEKGLAIHTDYQQSMMVKGRFL